jgi:integrase
MAIGILRQLHALTGDHLHVLPSARRKLKPNSSYSQGALSYALRKNEKHFEIAHFTCHDLRRTCAIEMGAMEIDELHIEKVLNHTIRGVHGIYNHHDYFDQKREALLKWADRLQQIIDNRFGKPAHRLALVA